MMLSARGITSDVFTLAKLMGTYEPYGTHNRDAIRVLNQQLFGYAQPQANQPGYRLAELHGQPNEITDFTARFVKDIDDGWPVYLTLNLATIYPGKAHGEHNVAGIGYESAANGQVTAILYLDPYQPFADPQTGPLHRIAPADLVRSIQACEEANYAW